MKRQLLFLFSVLSTLIVKPQDSSFTIDGKFEKVKRGNIFLTIYEGDNTITDTARIINGNFKFTGVVPAPFPATLTLAGISDYFTFYVEAVHMSITGSGDALKLLTVKGSSLNDDDRLFKETMKNITAWEDANSKIFEKAHKQKDTHVMDSLDEVDFEVLNEKRKIVTEFVKDHPQSMKSAMAILENYGYYAQASDVEPLYNLLGEHIRNSAKGSELKRLIELYKTVAVGTIAPDIIQSTPGGDKLSLSSLRGKYVLVDFWASWCGPCRRENPKIVAAYELFKDKGFTIFGVSYDEKKDRWKKAIEDDKLNWNQVSDLQGWKNSTSDQYGIKAIPSNLLLDKDGKIIAKNIFGKKLIEKLSEVMP